MELHKQTKNNKKPAATPIWSEVKAEEKKLLARTNIINKCIGLSFENLPSLSGNESLKTVFALF